MNEKLIKLIVKDITVLWSEDRVIYEKFLSNNKALAMTKFPIDIFFESLRESIGSLSNDKTKLSIELYSGEKVDILVSSGVKIKKVRKEILKSIQLL